MKKIVGTTKTSIDLRKWAGQKWKMAVHDVILTEYTVTPQWKDNALVLEVPKYEIGLKIELRLDKSGQNVDGSFYFKNVRRGKVRFESGQNGSFTIYPRKTQNVAKWHFLPV